MDVMKNLGFSFDYQWEPFEVEGKHLSFYEHKTTRLNQNKCSHWGAAIYKWEGMLDDGPNSGRKGILIGETDNLRQRIKQYISGTQPNGNAYWRKNFLERGEIYLYILNMERVVFESYEELVYQKDMNPNDFSSGNRRVIYEQLLILREVELRDKDDEIWVVNRKL